MQESHLKLTPQRGWRILPYSTACSVSLEMAQALVLFNNNCSDGVPNKSTGALIGLWCLSAELERKWRPHRASFVTPGRRGAKAMHMSLQPKRTPRSPSRALAIRTTLYSRPWTVCYSTLQFSFLKTYMNTVMTTSEMNDILWALLPMPWAWRGSHLNLLFSRLCARARACVRVFFNANYLFSPSAAVNFVHWIIVVLCSSDGVQAINIRTSSRLHNFLAPHILYSTSVTLLFRSAASQIHNKLALIY